MYMYLGFASMTVKPYEVYLLSSVITDYIIVKSHAYCKFQLITYEKGLYTCVV